MKILLVVVIILGYGKENDDKNMNRAGEKNCVIVSHFDLLLRIFGACVYVGSCQIFTREFRCRHHRRLKRTNPWTDPLGSWV